MHVPYDLRNVPAEYEFWIKLNAGWTVDKWQLVILSVQCGFDSHFLYDLVETNNYTNNFTNLQVVIPSQSTNYYVLPLYNFSNDDICSSNISSITVIDGGDANSSYT